ncbi:hypothetical protein M0802_010386 [Mischocyttarus mexicanus]|nr:hypothetical protein M0802_010386 [Mischocyttarus mexicanus]
MVCSNERIVVQGYNITEWALFRPRNGVLKCTEIRIGANTLLLARIAANLTATPPIVTQYKMALMVVVVGNGRKRKREREFGRGGDGGGGSGGGSGWLPMNV